MNQPTSTSIGLGTLRSDQADPLSPIERLRRLAALERADLIVIVVYAIAIGLVSLAVPIAAQALVNTVAFTTLLQPLVVLAVLVFGGLCIAGVLRALQYKVVETLQQRFFVRLAHDAIRRLTRSDVRAFSKHAAPEMVNRFFEVPTIQKAAATLLIDGLSVVLQSGVSLLLLAFYHPALLAFDVVLIAAIAFTIFGLGRGGVASAIRESKAKYAAASWLEEVAGSLRTFKPDRSDAFAFQKSDALARAYVEARQEHFRVLFRQTLASYALQAMATAALLGLGGTLVIKGQLTLGQLVAAEIIVTGVLVSASKLGKYLESFYDLCASLDKVGQIVDLPEERAGGLVHAPRAEPARLTLERIAFSYSDNGGTALEDVNLDLAPGEAIAILGGDASGKSTLVDVLFGLLQPTQGRALLDGVDVRTLALSDIRRDVAIVGGKPDVVDATLIDNLALGFHRRLDGEEATKVLAQVALTDEVARLPEGLLTRLGPAGRRLTSSQAARLALARCLVASPRLLILDETLDGLGTETARKIVHNITSTRSTMSLVVFTSREEIAKTVGHTLHLHEGVLRDEGHA